ncbi:MAG: hypothetical protein R3D00_16565 [Bacteroidia bacterium]
MEIGWNKSLPLSWIGYVKGSTLDLSNRAHNAIAPQSGALTPSYPIEELQLPMPLYLKYVGKWGILGREVGFCPNHPRRREALCEVGGEGGGERGKSG